LRASLTEAVEKVARDCTVKISRKRVHRRDRLNRRIGGIEDFR
jgi:hypothetical protein